ncbi:tRNA (adenosine(37)-N6)-threonylcarbamoyltransferase complex dimerization subunit type 1 TsaB [Aeoliella sp. ICT_H6.2]|uniref:tRNA (Adenosine(37)-N6)-threonylcarbamoyltransferase complex dimerization subunit type 1 TsaB n=1 Tax=Aeoliella straminimaris TaxID=2954799 RepID=A0A9X2JF61_9BACT|nr:tRNA (adenosine(37)-N6)-threonylcarbamoyltransferase complex dimerization subunit type 1 TsaB [Aeoliella straminimaris]MCO6043720.1 tRNA (adenosine(37)-N6)-threonylcarbamoyltransferase complex dimerization subunit type 1 TsaB [Aeoliella straminimaris]
MNYSPLLALETSGRTASLALFCQETLYQQVTLPAGERVAVGLVPATKQLLAGANIAPAGLAAVAVASGPGSFTGLRIGITAAKTLAYATGAQLVGVNTLDALATQVANASEEPSDGHIWAVLDAQRGDVFAAKYDRLALDQLGETDRTQLLAGAQWLEQLRPGDVVVGPVTDRYRERIPEGVALATGEQCQPQARSVGTLALSLLGRGITSDPFQLVPHYHRLSAAEEKARASRAG